MWPGFEFYATRSMHMEAIQRHLPASVDSQSVIRI